MMSEKPSATTNRDSYENERERERNAGRSSDSETRKVLKNVERAKMLNRTICYTRLTSFAQRSTLAVSFNVLPNTFFSLSSLPLIS